MNRLASSVVAGVVAAVIWTIISLAVGFSGGMVALWAVVMLVGVTVITFGISTVIGATRSTNRP